MWAELKKLLHDCLTENDEVTYCPFRVGGFVLSGSAVPTFIGGAIWDICKTGHFDAMTFAGAFSTMMGGLTVLAAGVAIKARTDAPSLPRT
jgi:hypothetical protein